MQLLEEDPGVEDAVESLHSVSTAAVEVVSSPWCCFQCVRVKTCRCLLDHGFGFFFFCLHIGDLRSLAVQGLRSEEYLVIVPLFILVRLCDIDIDIYFFISHDS